MNLKQIYECGTKRLRKAGVPEAQLDAWILLEYVTGIRRTAYYADPEKEISKEQYDRYDRYIEKRCSRIPLQHITGEQEFMGLTFRVNSDVLIPRQDTETLVETAVGILNGAAKLAADENGYVRVLDMCTGSGCILLSVIHHAKCRIRGTGTDISEKALKIAEENAQSLGLEAEFIQSDLFERVKGRFSLILSNPPYIRTADIEELQDEVRLHDPVIALDGKEDGLYFYRRIIAESTGYLEDGGVLAFEIGWDQAEDVSGLMKQKGFESIEIKKDLAGLDRVVYGRYIR